MLQPETPLRAQDLALIHKRFNDLCTRLNTDCEIRKWCIERAVEYSVENNMPFDISVAEVIHQFIVKEPLNTMRDELGVPDGLPTLDTKTS